MPKANETSDSPDEEAISRRAYELYLQRGSFPVTSSMTGCRRKPSWSSERVERRRPADEPRRRSRWCADAIGRRAKRVALESPSEPDGAVTSSLDSP